MLTEPVNVAAAAGLAVGLTPPLKALFVSGAPLGWAMNSCKTVGTACFPLMTLLLGCNLAQGTSSDRVDMPSVGVVTIVRLVVFPFVCLGVSRFCMAKGWLPDDPMIQFVILLEGCVPTAMTMGMAAPGPNTQKAVSAMLFWQVCKERPFGDFHPFRCFCASVRPQLRVLRVLRVDAPYFI
mmetsp:Transcript_23940/g.64735  ORF Transcript_23940/g.64735 Transcript_23940/m.64735 type:complete len:181 (-) Transcript_23940:216-758(-)